MSDHVLLWLCALGDADVWCACRRVWKQLSSQAGTAELAAEHPAIARFLRHMDTLSKTSGYGFK